MVICLAQGANLHMAQLMPLPLTVSWFSKIQIGFTFPVPAHLGTPGKRAVKRVCYLATTSTRAKLVYQAMQNEICTFTAKFNSMLLTIIKISEQQQSRSFTIQSTFAIQLNEVSAIIICYLVRKKHQNISIGLTEKFNLSNGLSEANCAT